MRLNSHIGVSIIDDPTQTHNNRISCGSIIKIDSYFGTWRYEKYCSQLRPTASAGCNISHNAMCLSLMCLGYTPAARLGSSIARLRLLSLINSKRNAVFPSDENISTCDSNYYKKKSDNYRNYAFRLHCAQHTNKKNPRRKVTQIQEG